ncbi:MAG: hypothetical protein QXL15_03025 [Candidatus Korarchaeota archaeon]
MRWEPKRAVNDGHMKNLKNLPALAVESVNALFYLFCYCVVS